MRKKLEHNTLVIIICISLLIALFYLITLSGISIRNDEPFTMGLVHNSYMNIIRIDSMDVHPPLYYLVLRLFLSFTTFYTRSIYIKIIFSRIFTVLVFIISFYVLYKIVNNLLHLNIKWYLLLLGYIIMPSILINITQIRMYEFASMFLILELYNIIKFNIYSYKKNLIYSVISAAIVSYIHYFAAVSARYNIINIYH